MATLTPAMPPRTPQLRLHNTGVYFCRWGGRDHYFTKDSHESSEAYGKSLEEWRRWRFGQASPLGAQRPGRRLTLARAYTLFLESIEGDVEPVTIAYYEKHLCRFVNLWGAAPMRELGAPELDALKTDMKRIGYARRTINHELIAVKRLFNWAADMTYIPPVSFRGVKRLRLPLPRNKALPVDQVRALLAICRHGKAWVPAPPRAQQGAPAAIPAPPLSLPGWRSDPLTRALLEGAIRNEALVPWLELNYYALLRPSEVVRLVHGQGEWIDHGVFCLSRSKTELTAQVYRFIPLSDRALDALSRAPKTWARPDSYYQAFADACGPGGPGRLRHSAATHLRALRATREDIDLILGHLPSAVSLTYTQETWQPLRATAARLDLGALA